MPAPDGMSRERLACLVGPPKDPLILDVFRDAVRATDPRVLPGARPLAEAGLSPEGRASRASGSSALKPGMATVRVGAAGLGLALHPAGFA
jgi:hypothetical protein